MLIGMDSLLTPRLDGQRYTGPDASGAASARQAELPPATELTGKPLVAELEIDLEPVYVLDLSGNRPELPKLELPNLSLPAERAAQPDGGSAPSVRREVESAEGDSPVEQKAPCQTCEGRKYVDESDDSGVSYQVPTKLPSSVAAIRVAAHEREHVFNERADAKREGAEVVHQSVSLRYGCCPECGDMYVAGGETRTVTSKEAEEAYSRFKHNEDEGKYRAAFKF